jgi:hypothetical protein
LKERKVPVKIALIFVSCLSAIPINGLRAQSIDPETLFSANALAMVDIPNAEHFIKLGKAEWYDVWFAEAIQSNQLRTLDFPALQFFLSRRNGSKEHWFPNTIESFRSKGNPTLDELVALANAFKRNSFEFSPHDEQRAVELLASLFPGTVCWGVERRKNYLEFVFAFEYDRTVFDWQKELIAASSDNEDKAEPVARVGNVEIFSLPGAEIHFFSHENVIYGTSSIDQTRCEQLARRVLKLDPNAKTLAQSRHFKRVTSELHWKRNANSCLFFVRSYDLQKHLINGQLDELTGRRSKRLRPKDVIAPQVVCGWSEYCGGIVSVGNKSQVEFRVVFPLVVPLAKEMETVIQANGPGLSSNREYEIPAKGMTVVQGISERYRESWKRLPLANSAMCAAPSMHEISHRPKTAKEIELPDLFADLVPEESISTVQPSQNGNSSNTRLLFSKHVMIHSDKANAVESIKETPLIRFRLSEVFNDIDSDECLLAFEFSDNSCDYCAFFSCLNPLFCFIGRCDSSHQFGTGAAWMKGDYAIAFRPENAKRAIQPDSPAIMNLASVVASNFFEPCMFIDSLGKVLVTHIEGNRMLLVSKSTNAIICRGILKRPSKEDP